MQTKSPRSVMQARRCPGSRGRGWPRRVRGGSSGRRVGLHRAEPSAVGARPCTFSNATRMAASSLARLRELFSIGAAFCVLVDQLARLRVERQRLPAGVAAAGAPRRDRGAQEQGRAEEGAQGQRPAGPRSLLPDEGLLLRRRHEGLLVVHVHCYCSLLLLSTSAGSAEAQLSLLLLSTSAGSAEAQLFGNAVVVPIRFPVSKLCCSLRVPAAAFRRRRLVSALQTRSREDT